MSDMTEITETEDPKGHAIILKTPCMALYCHFDSFFQIRT